MPTVNIDVASAPTWLLLIHQIPPKPDYFRVRIGRRLQKIGAVPIKSSVYVLPDGDQRSEDFQWIRSEIVDGGGEALVCRASFIEGMSDEELRNSFRAARDADYREIGDAIQVFTADRTDETPLLGQELSRLERKLASIAAIDFFGAAEGDVVRRALDAAKSTGTHGHAIIAMRSADRSQFQGRTWVTRHDIFVDRMASAWLIQRFIDTRAQFQFIGGASYVHRDAELRFDMTGGEFTHEGNYCTFETLLTRFEINDAALVAIAEMVHDIDLKDSKFMRAETAGIQQVIEGIARSFADDTERLNCGFQLFDQLYAALQPSNARP